VGVKAIIAPESFRKQNYYEIIDALIPQMKNSVHGRIENNSINNVRNVIIHLNTKLP
jgi:fatty-acyl-CoA synthase